MKILIVRPRLIGDVILTTPAIQALRRRFPDAELLYLVEALAAPVLESNPHLSGTIVLRHRRGWRRVAEDARLAARLRRARIDIAIDLHGGPRSGWLTWATRAPLRVGYDTPGRQWMYTRRVPRPRGYAPRHSVLNQWDLLAEVDPALATPPDPERDRLEMPVSAAAAASVAARLEAQGVGASDAIVVLHASAGNEFRRWPAESFAAVAAALLGADARRWIIVVGSPGDREAMSAVVTGARNRAGAAGARITAAEGWPLTEMRALCERAALFVGGDSGPMHVAATSNVPIVAVFGPTLPALWASWRPSRLPTATVDGGTLPCRPCDQRVCGPGDFRCLTRISAAQVIDAAERLLERRR